MLAPLETACTVWERLRCFTVLDHSVALVSRDMTHLVQEEREMTLEQFKFRFGDEPKKDELTIFVPRQDDPTDTVGL